MSGDHPVVAVVDDDPSVCNGLRRLLQSAGLSATAFQSGPAFLASLEATQPDCVVLDVSMPEMTGFEVQARMRAVGCRIPVILISADERPRRREDALRAGACAFLAKPFDGELLIATVESALGDQSLS